MKNNFSINFDLVKELFDRINKEDNIEYTNSLSLLQSIEPEYQEFMKHYLFTRYFVVKKLLYIYKNIYQIYYIFIYC